MQKNRNTVTLKLRRILALCCAIASSVFGGRWIGAFITSMNRNQECYKRLFDGIWLILTGIFILCCARANRDSICQRTGLVELIAILGVGVSCFLSVICFYLSIPGKSPCDPGASFVLEGFCFTVVTVAFFCIICDDDSPRRQRSQRGS